MVTLCTIVMQKRLGDRPLTVFTNKTQVLHYPLEHEVSLRRPKL
jgi:hypothetical protein